MSNNFSLQFALAAVILVLAGAPPLAAQNVVTTGQIRGRISDEAGAPVVSATVVARNVETGLERGAITDRDGIYIVRLLPPGHYEIRAEVIGYQPTTLPPTRVAIGQTSTANIVMRTQAVALEAIEVIGERQVLDVTDGGVVQLVGQQQIETLPSLGRDFVDFIGLSGFVAPDPDVTTGGQFALAGARPSGTNVQIDGVDANNLFFGENRGGSRIPFVFSLESIREFQIITNGFDVEHASYSGGIVNVVTRGGTNEWEGTAYVNYRGDALTGDPFIIEPTNRDLTTDYEVQQFAGRLSGPIVKDQAHFLVSVDGQRRREPQLPLTLAELAPGGSGENAVLEEQMQQFFEILEQQYGVGNSGAGFQPFETTNDAITLFGRIDWSLSQNHRLTLRHNYSNFSNDREFNANFDFEYGLSRAERIQDVSNSLVAELQSVLGPSTYNVFRFQWANEERPRDGRDIRPTLSVRLPARHRQNDLLRYGGTFVAFNNNLEERKFQFINTFTHVFGQHTLKLGGSAMFTRILNQFQAPMSGPAGRQSAGEFLFNNMDDFAAFRPSLYIRPMQLGGGISRAEFDVADWGVFLQDEWRVTPKLTATLGVRYDNETFADDPDRLVDVERAFGYPTGSAPVDDNNISPRFSLAYDVYGDGRAVARAGAGYFYGRVPFVLGGNVMQTVLPIVELSCAGSALEGDPDAPPAVVDYRNWSRGGADNPISCLESSGATGLPTYSTWSPDFELPEIFKANLGYEQLLSDRARISLDLLYSRTTNEFSVRNLNLRDPQFTLDHEGGRRIFTPASVFDPSGGNAPNARRNTRFGDVFVNFNDGRAEAIIGTLRASYAFSPAWRFEGSYTFARGWDNISDSCCTAGELHGDPTVGEFGPNDLGGIGDFERSWGRTDYQRDHTFVVSGFGRLPLGIDVAAFWRLQSGRPWTPEVSGDINGDGVSFNDRPFVFRPEDVPLNPATFGSDPEADQRARYAAILAKHDCVGDHVGGIVERNTCRYPWTNQLDLRLTRRFDTFQGQRLELQLDMFNVVNGIGQLLCDEDERKEDPIDGACGWGRVNGIFGANRNLLFVSGFDQATNRILYSVPRADATTPSRTQFAKEGVRGSNLLLQFQAQIGVKYFF
ncbi:MAG: TonB-dependent receptor [Gemmatimonadetes bacterium]|nr:TonB-dependent receptor [Gemmatimonadota bacterium]